MTGSQKALCVFAWITIAYGIIDILIGAAVIVSGAMIGSDMTFQGDGVSLDGTSAGMIVGMGAIVPGVVMVIVGVLGLRGAKSPSKIGPFWTLALIGVILNALELVSQLFGGDLTSVIGAIFGFALVLACFILANNIKKQLP